MLKERNQTRVHTKGCHLYKILENANHSDKKQINDCQYKGKGRDRREEVDFGKLWGVMDMFTILIVVIVFLGVSKFISLYILSICSLLYVVCACSLTCPTLCDHVDYSPPGSSAHGILQVRILELVAISYSKGSSQPRDQTQVSCIVRQIFYLTTEPPGKPLLYVNYALIKVFLIFFGDYPPFLFFIFWPQCVACGLNSLTRDWTHAPEVEDRVSTTGPQGNSQ